MAVIIKNLASGTLNGTTTTKDLGPDSGKSWVIKGVTLTNRDSVARTVDVKVTGTSPNTAAYLMPPNTILGGLTTLVIDDEITLQYPASESQEKLTLTLTGTPASPGMDYVLSGIERDLS